MFRFSDTAAHQFARGMLFLGRDPKTGRDIGIATEKGAITVASSRTGKGAALIIPNLLRWPGNSLTIDPSGENASETWQQLESQGIKVAVLDPFRVAKVPARLRASCNLLSSLNPASLTIREDIRVIADGLVMRHDPKHNQWADRQVDLIAGVIAHVLTTAPPQFRTLLDVVAALNMSRIPADDDRESPLEAFFRSMCENPACAGLAIKGGNVGLNSLKSKSGDSPDGAAVSGVQSELDWISSLGMADILESSTFDLAELKSGKIAVFLVLPPDYLDEHGRFLRLFVRCAISAMTKGGKVGELNERGGLNRPCLFLLDEFFSLGHLNVIQKAAGLLPKYGVHLWPFLQDIGQLLDLYGENASETFFGNADAQIFFGTADGKTLNYVSERIGNTTMHHMPPPPQEKPWPEKPKPGWWMHENQLQDQRHMDEISIVIAQNMDASAGYEKYVSLSLGKPLFLPREIGEMVGKFDGDKVARSMIVFGKGGAVFNLALAPYYAERNYRPPPRLLEHKPELPSNLRVTWGGR